MKCLRKIALVGLLVFVVNSLAFCGWDAFKSSPEDLEIGGSVTSQMIEETQIHTEQQQTSLPEAVKEEKTIDSVSRNSKESSATYEDMLEETAKAIEKVEDKCPDCAEAIEEAKAIVDDLVVSKSVMDEDYDILESLVKRQAKELESYKRKAEGVNFGIGLSMGYSPMSVISPGITLQMRSKQWTFRTDVNYRIDITAPRSELLSVNNLDFRVGVIYEFN